MATLNLHPNQPTGAQPKKAAVPKFDPNDNYGEVYTDQGAKCYIQLKNFFERHGDNAFIGEAPQHMWMEPLTSEQRNNLAVSRAKNKKFWQGAKPQTREAGIPKQVVDAEKENARALAAETQAA